MARDGDDRDVPLVEDPAGRLDPVDPRQSEVEQDHVRTVRAGELDGLDTVASVRAHVEAGVFEHESQVGPDDRIVLDGQDRGSSK